MIGAALSASLLSDAVRNMLVGKVVKDIIPECEATIFGLRLIRVGEGRVGAGQYF